MWNDLIDELLPSSTRTDPARQYLKKYVWEKRKKWTTTYFEDEFTFGTMSTQRSEGWHAALKQAADLKTSSGLFDSIDVLVKRQTVFELRFSRMEQKKTALKDSVLFYSRPFISLTIEMSYYSFECREIDR